MSIAIVHVSDLHFADRWFPKGYAPAPVAAAPPLGIGLINGFNGHDIAACRHLDECVADFFHHWSQANKPEWRLLVASGDLTARGGHSEFALALTYLRGIIHEGWTNRVGLGKYEFDDFMAVAGNHDHWGGTRRRTIGYSGKPLLHGNYFPVVPGTQCWFKQYYRQGSNIALQLMGVDTACGARRNLLARGSIDNADLFALQGQINASNAVLSVRPVKIVRVLVAHHGLNMPANSAGTMHELDANSARALRNFVAQNNIHRLLTGHLHEPFVHPKPACKGEELRSGTTLQVSAKAQQTFLLHRFEVVGGKTVFETTTYQRTIGTGFRPVAVASAYLC